MKKSRKTRKGARSRVSRSGAKAKPRRAVTTKRRTRAKSATSGLDNLLEQAHEAIYVCDLDGTIDYWNRGAERLYGYKREEVRGRMSHGLFGAADEQVAAVRRSLAKTGQWRGELVHRTKRGRELVVDSDQTVIRGERTRVLIANRDVTERRQLEQSLRRRIDELAAADRQKNEFVAMLAHELRNPLAPLRNAVEILRNPAKSAEDAVRTQDLIDRQISKMSRLVDDLLDATRITRGQIQLRKEPTDLRQILQRAAETTLDVIKSRSQQLVLGSTAHPLVVDADPGRLEQVFANLLTNASKYSQDRGTITVDMSLGSDENGRGPVAVVRVTDGGIGIEKEMIPRVFDLFAQADRALARTQGGLGIGLSLVKSLVDLHGGHVSVHSEGRDRGSEFTVYLPAIKAAAPQRRA
jgi:two-component system CheB/CheR fusion protein